MNMLKGLIKGIFIGAGAILPGISSGVLCVVFGIYEKIVNSILNFFSDIKDNAKFLLPIVSGVIIGVFLFGNILKFLFINYNKFAKICFSILIISSIPSVIKKINIDKIEVKHVLASLLTLSFSISLVFLESHDSLIFLNNSFIALFIVGIIMSAGVVIPGVSSTIILMLLGKYEIYLSAISEIDLNILFPIGIGLFFGSISLLYLIRFLLKKYKDITYFAIIGFVIGSLPILL